MPWLFIDTRKKEASRVALIPTEGRMRIGEFNGRGAQLLSSIERMKLKPSELDGVIVAAGPGSFSSVRLGVLTANLFARLLHMPLYAIRTSEPVVDLEALRATMLAGELKAEAYVPPIYDREPNITTKTA